MNPGDTIPRSCRIAATIALLLLFNSTWAQLSSYKYQRKIKPGYKEGWYAISLPQDAIAKSECSMNDFRIYRVNEKDTTEIPYLIEHMGDKTEVKNVPFDLVNNTHNENGSSFVTLKFGGKRVINEIKLDVQESNFDKWVKVQGSMDNKEWFTIRERIRIVGFYNGEVNYSYTTLRFKPSEYSYFRLVFDDAWSPRITVTGANASEVITDEGRYEELTVKKKDVKQDKPAKTTEVYLDLSAAYAVDHVVITPAAKEDFYRDINLYYLAGVTKAQTGDIEHWVLINTGIFSSFGDDKADAASTSPSTTLLCGQQTKRLKLEIINRDNQPVEVGDIKVYAESVRLVSKLPSEGELVLAYGKPQCTAPEYDIVHFTKTIPANPGTVQLENEKTMKQQEENGKKPLVGDKVWLWVAMGGILLIIGVFSVSMLRKTS